jgi:hypothetical protein
VSRQNPVEALAQKLVPQKLVRKIGTGHLFQIGTGHLFEDLLADRGLVE